MVDRLISRFRVWHFGHACRHHPERIGIELIRVLVEARDPALRAHTLDLMRSERVGMLRVALLRALAASRWNITNDDDIARVIESLTGEQERRLHSCVSSALELLWRGGGSPGSR
jgi:hypothetical protein